VLQYFLEVMMTMHTTVGHGPATHDPAGDDVQVHEVGDDVYITLSDTFVEREGWQLGDELVWDATTDPPTVSNPQADVRRMVRDAVARELEKP
jgi:hypothetical protein